MKKDLVIKFLEIVQEDYEVSKSPTTVYLNENGERERSGSTWGRTISGLDGVSVSATYTAPLAKRDPERVDWLHRIIDGVPLSRIPPRFRDTSNADLGNLGEIIEKHFAEDLRDGYGRRIIFSYPEDRPIASSIKHTSTGGPLPDDDE